MGSRKPSNESLYFDSHDFDSYQNIEEVEEEDAGDRTSSNESLIYMTPNNSGQDLEDLEHQASGNLEEPSSDSEEETAPTESPNLRSNNGKKDAFPPFLEMLRNFMIELFTFVLEILGKNAAEIVNSLLFVSPKAS